MAQTVKILPAVQDLGSIPGSERSPGEENGYPLHSMDRGPWWAIAHGVAEESDTTERLSKHTFLR